MRIESYGLNTAPLTPAARRPAAPAAEPQPPAAGAAELTTPQERLRQLLEQKRWMAEAAFAETSPEPELGKHIDLRV